MAIQSNQRLNLAQTSGEYLNNLALVYLWSGRLAEAQDALRRAIQIAKLEENFIVQATMQSNLAKTYSMVGDVNLARRYYEQALAMSKEQVKDEDTANIRLSLAKLDWIEGDFQGALAHLSAAEAVAQQLRPEKLAIVYAMMAKSHAKLNQIEKALDTLNMAEIHSEKVLKNSDKAQLWLFISETELALGDWVSAATHLEQSKRFLPEAHPLRVELLMLEYLIAEHLQEDNLRATQDLFEQARKVIFALERTLDFHKMGPNWLSHVRQIYDLHMMALASNPNKENVEQLVRLMDEYQSTVFQRRRHFYATQNEQHNEQLSLLWQQKLQAEVQVMHAQLKERAQAQKKLDEISEKWNLAQQADIAIDSQSNVEELSIESMQAALDADTAILRFFNLDSQCFVVHLDRLNWSLSPISCPARDQSKHQKNSPKAWLNENRFAQEFVPKSVLNHSQISKLVIIADTDFQLMPFSALRTDKSEYRYLGEQFEIEHAVSLYQFVGQLSYGGSSQNLDMAIFDSPSYPLQSDLRSTGRVPDDPVELAWTKHEGQVISSLFANYKVQRSTGKHATNSALLSSPFRNARILHLATHGYYDSNKPDIVGLLTSPQLADDMSTPGFISQDFLLSRSFSNQLVVLSGCETAMGEFSGSEGLRSLSYGLLSAGASSTISTLWKVADRPTALFMEHFYKALIDTADSAKALQIARQALIKNPRYRDPKYWAAFRLTVVSKQSSQFYF